MKTYLFVSIAILVALTLAMVACAPRDEEDEDDWGGDGLCDACRDAAPDPEDLDIDIPGDDENGGDTKGAVGELAEYYNDTVDISRALNFWILGHLGWLDEILSFPPSEHEGEYCIWGPFIPSGLSPVEVQFKMKRVSVTTFDYYWQERPKNTENEWSDVWGGDIVPATDTARRGIGNLFIDYTLAKQLDPTIDTTGVINVEYDTYSDGRQIDITFDQFSFTEYEAPANASYRYHNHADNTGEFTFVLFADLGTGGPSADLETFSYETQWLGSGAGDCTLTISGGDINEDTSHGSPLQRVEGYECWSSQFLRTYFKETAFLADGTEVLLSEEGSAGQCPAF